MAITGGFGFEFDIKTGRGRNWYFKDGVKRWADDDSPVNNVRLADDVARCVGVGDDSDGWREGCECCARRLAGPASNGRTNFIAPPAMIVFCCEHRIEL